MKGVIHLNIQLKKGALDLCVLSLLYRGDKYGYELVSKISEQIHISEGTMYPLLKRIHEDGLVTTYLKESNEGPPRKYYALTDIGIQTKLRLEDEWLEFVEGINLIVRGDENDEE